MPQISGTIAAIRARLAGAKGREYWRSLEELAETPEFQDFLENEFPQHAPDWREPVNRRTMLRLMGASLALGGLSACTRQPEEKIVPYVRAPEEIIPGKPLFFATASVHGGYAKGILVESHMGRPTKVEGNPLHPGSLGATDIYAQASPLTFYDPDRSQVALKEGRLSSIVAFLAELSLIRESHLIGKGAGLRILTETVTSPTMGDQLKAVLTDFPQAKVYQWDPVTSDNVKEGARLAFGEPVSIQYRIEQADVIVSLDADFLNSGPGDLRYSREFARRRKPEGGNRMNRLYAVEPTPSVTGSIADHRYPVRASAIEGIARALATGAGSAEPWVAAITKDLEAHRGASLVIAGETQPPIVHALAHSINEKLGNVGKTVVYTDPVEPNPASQLASLKALVEEMKTGQMQTLLILGGNPVHTAPADLGFREHFLKVKQRIHVGLYQGETALMCHWHVPQAHPLESWDDARAFDGTVTLLQPLIEPLYGGKTHVEILAGLLNKSMAPYDILKSAWQARTKVADFDAFWEKALHDGVVPDTALAAKNVTVKGDLSASAAAPAGEIEITFRPDPTLWDGRYANNGWLQELPKPATKLTWDNAAYISPTLAERLQLENEALIDLKVKDRRVRIPVWIVPGQAKDSVTVHFGHGRTQAGRVGSNSGFDVYPLRTSTALWHDAGAEIRKAGDRFKLAPTQTHHSMEGRDPVRSGTIAEYEKNPEFVQHMGEEPPKELTLYAEHVNPEYSWGMAIDLNVCTGCSACVVACQAENNIPVVGKEQVTRGREMHWIRIDRYHAGGLDNPALYSQPMLCQHCENAPCEPVCPVAATSHSNEGLNQMVYNRCVGTRYCSNNCPYKVRRFNFYLYSDWNTASLESLRNPNVTVRSRGVMEKCTYCVQRINAAKITAEKEDRRVRDGDIATACQAACPTEAIIFGDIKDTFSRVHELRESHRNYGVLAEINTRPRTTYLARLRNPNPELEKEG